MKKISKLIFSISCFLICLTLSIVGVVAATTTSVTVVGTVSFTPTDIGLQIACLMTNSTSEIGKYYIQKNYDSTTGFDESETDTYAFETWNYNAIFDSDLAFDDLQAISQSSARTYTSDMVLYMQFKNFVQMSVITTLNLTYSNVALEENVDIIVEYKHIADTSNSTTSSWWTPSSFDGNYSTNGTQESPTTDLTACYSFNSKTDVSSSYLTAVAGTKTTKNTTHTVPYTASSSDEDSTEVDSSNYITIPSQGITCLKITLRIKDEKLDESFEQSNFSFNFSFAKAED